MEYDHWNIVLFEILKLPYMYNDCKLSIVF